MWTSFGIVLAEILGLRSTKGENCIVHSSETFQHRSSRDQVKRPHSVNGRDGYLGIQHRQPLKNAGHAFATCPRRHRILVWVGCAFNGLISHLLTRKWERQLVGREEVPPSLAYQPWCNICVRVCGPERRHESRSHVQPKYTCHPMRLLLSSGTQCADRWSKKGNRDPASVIPARSREEIRSTHGSQPRRMLSTDTRDHAPHM